MLKRILGLLGWLGVALVFAAVAIRFLKPEWQWYTNLALGGLGCTVLYMLSQWREVARSFSGREAKFGTVAIVSAIVALAILVAVNYLGVRHNKRWDLTAAKQFTLSDQTHKILAGLQKPVAIKVFARSADFQRFHERLDEYQYASKQVSVEYVDILKQPSRAQQAQVQTEGTVVFEYDGRTERVTSDGEQELTNGLIKVVQGTQQKVYFVLGHGEKTIEGGGNESYSVVSTSLKSENYTVDKLVLAQQTDVPADASVLIIAGPKTDLFAPEIAMLKRYLAKGGKVLFMLDPPEKPESGGIPNITGLLKDWGIEVGDNVVVDVSSIGRMVGTGPETPIAASYQPHPITEHFELLTAYRLARSVAPITGGTSGKFPQALVDTSPNSWGETDIKTLSTTGEVKRDIDKGDKAGPVSLAAAVSSPATDVPAPAAGAKPDDAAKAETRVVVFGDSDFASNGWLAFQGNRDLFLNTVNWLSKQENLIAIRPRDPQDRGVTMTAGQQNLVRLISQIGIPLLIIIGGVAVWAARRR
jgi:ABC-type uncharacterized transport system involved in gliding motility auxiliary subunit